MQSSTWYFLQITCPHSAHFIPSSNSVLSNPVKFTRCYIDMSPKFEYPFRVGPIIGYPKGSIEILLFRLIAPKMFSPCGSVNIFSFAITAIYLQFSAKIKPNPPFKTGVVANRIASS